VSLENLMSFPFVREAVEGETLSIHGLWTDIGDGSLFCFDQEDATWRTVE
jgi:carbonic anhydrase